MCCLPGCRPSKSDGNWSAYLGPTRRVTEVTVETRPGNTGVAPPYASQLLCTAQEDPPQWLRSLHGTPSHAPFQK